MVIGKRPLGGGGFVGRVQMLLVEEVLLESVLGRCGDHQDLAVVCFLEVAERGLEDVSKTHFAPCQYVSDEFVWSRRCLIQN